MFLFNYIEENYVQQIGYYMPKLLFSLIISLFVTQATARNYILVGVSGFGTNNTTNSQPSGAHDLLPDSAYGKISNTYKLIHFSPKKDLKEVINEFDCKNGKQEMDLGLIIMANSWGSSKGIKLSKMYKKSCSRGVDLFIMIDGVKKPIGAQGRRPKAKRCINYYQTIGLIRGKPIKGCKNHDLTKAACQNVKNGIECHIEVEWQGATNGSKEIKKFIKNN